MTDAAAKGGFLMLLMKMGAGIGFQVLLGECTDKLIFMEY